MKTLKLGMLVCGALGIAGLLTFGIDELMELDKRYTILMMAAFALPIIMGAMSLAKPPLQAWQAGVALSGFSLVAWKLEIWHALRQIADGPNGQKLMVIGATLGMIFAVLAVIRPEPQRVKA